MNRLPAILLSLLLLTASFPVGVSMLAFELNRSEIVEAYCVERDSESNCCQGSCFFDQQLAEALAPGSHLPQPMIPEIDPLQYLVEDSPLAATDNEVRGRMELALFDHDLISDPHCCEVFHPPDQVRLAS